MQENIQLLIQACCLGNTARVKQLLTAGMNVNAANKWGTTPLIAAASFGQSETIQFLLTKGANLHLVDDQGCSVLFHAARRADTEIVELLLNQGSRWDQLDHAGLSCLAAAIEHDQLSVLGLLMKHARQTQEARNDALRMAARFWNPPLLLELLEQKAEVNAPDTRGRSALFHAVDTKREGIISPRGAYIIRYLLAHGADMNQPDSEGTTPLMRAKANGLERLAAQLGKAGAIG